MDEVKNELLGASFYVNLIGWKQNSFHIDLIEQCRTPFPCYHCSPVGLIPEPFSFLIFRNEFRPWIDVKPVKAIKAKPQYKPPEEKMTHETSYSAQFKGETSKPSPADNKYLERRRIRTLYSEPYKEPPKVRNTAEGTQGHHCSWWHMSNTVRLG